VASPISAARSQGGASHGFGSPGNLREQLSMRVFQADEIVAAIARRSENHPVPRLAQGFNGLNQQTRWQGRAVAIDEQDTVMFGKQERARRANQHVAEIIASLLIAIRTLPEAVAA